MQHRTVLATLVFLLLTGTALPTDGPAQGRDVLEMPAVAPVRDRIEPVNRMLVDRLDNLLPGLMREVGIDMWLVINREYVEDPVYRTLVPEPVFNARRSTMLVFFDRGGDEGVERLTVSRYGLGDLYEPAWEGGTDDDQWRRLVEVISERDPRRIGINTSEHWAFGDGLSAGQHEKLISVLPTKLRKRVTSAEELCLRWLETRTVMELEVYPQIVAIARRVIAEAFSNRVITPGVTTLSDVSWYMRDRFDELDLPVWFQPDVTVQPYGVDYEVDAPFFGQFSGVIHRGDLLHTDVGICYMRLCTDTQEMGYVLMPGEQEVPEGLKHAMSVGNRWQDLLTAEFRSGRSGNDVLAATHAAVEGESIRSATYSHPIGFFGHAPGPTIGMWDEQGPTPIRGDWKVYPNTAYAIEGYVKVQIPEWEGRWVQVKLEQSAVFDGERVRYLAGRQIRWHVIR
jgi:hypothetical protein